MRKVGVLDYGRRGLREGRGNCLKYLKRGWNKKDGRGNKDFKRGGGGGGGGGQAESRSGRLKKGRGLEAPYELS